MGANQSNLAKPEPKESLYDILGVERTATPDELKKAYRKIALILHPDRNYNNEEEATMKFTKVQAAYDLLSDEQERAWYDNHQGKAEYTEYTSVVTKTEEIKSYTDPAYMKSMKNKDEFYRLVSDLFERLRNEELEAAFEQKVDKVDVPVANIPLFGHSNTEWSEIRPFYDTWGSFSTLKSYSWEDLYPMHHAEDRRTRRAMESRNKRIRDAAKREFNEAVRNLVRNIRQNDPRVKKQQKLQQEKQDKVKARNKEKKEKANADLHYEEQEWAKIDYSDESDKEQTGDEVVHVFECIVCDKIFKNKAQLVNHEMSSKHVKALKKLQWQMKQEGIEFGLEGDDIPSSKSSAKNSARDTPVELSEDDDDEAEPITSDHEEQGDSDAVKELSKGVSALSVEDILSQLDGHRKKGNKAGFDSDDEKPTKKIGKAKKKRSQREQNVSLFALKCSTCQTEFPSRNKLFEHIKVSKHAAPVGFK